jgi:hypothetical protein
VRSCAGPRARTNGIEIEDTSANDKGPADRKPAGPDKVQSKLAAIKAAFQAAKAAITRRDPDAPKPRRSRSGETESEFRQFARRLARGPALRTAKTKAKAVDAKMADDCGAAVNPDEDAEIGPGDAVQWLQSLENNGASNMEINDAFTLISDNYGPHL